MSAPAPVSDFDVNPAALLSGTVNEGNIGPSVGLLDIGVSDSAYLFRLALPGILKEPSMSFSSFNSLAQVAMLSTWWSRDRMHCNLHYYVHVTSAECWIVFLLRCLFVYSPHSLFPTNLIFVKVAHKQQLPTSIPFASKFPRFGVGKRHKVE